jgi:hypothetical protein
VSSAPHSSAYATSANGAKVIAAACIALGYSYFAAYYRASAREIKRLGESIFH